MLFSISFRATDEEVQQHLGTATVKRSMLG